ncbi:MAG: nucleotidyltransferase family protein [Dehalococcoidia bacterium]|nr:nucleotidyltransferase family protein [Dehalococcoidia bacterium]
MLQREQVLDFLKQNKRDLETRFSVTRIGLFGSVLHGTAGNKSDVDLLVDMASPTFDHYMDLKFFLEDQLGRPIDLVLSDSLKPRLKPIVTGEVAYANT